MSLCGIQWSLAVGIVGVGGGWVNLWGRYRRCDDWGLDRERVVDLRVWLVEWSC